MNAKILFTIAAAVSFGFVVFAVVMKQYAFIPIQGGICVYSILSLRGLE